MDNLIVIGIVALILVAAIWYIRKEKRKGSRCIGCPSGGAGCSECNGCCGKCREE